MTDLHLVSGGDETRRRALVAHLALHGRRQEARSAGEGGTRPARELLTWGSGLVGGGGLAGCAAAVGAADEHLPVAWSDLRDAGDRLLSALGLSAAVSADLLGALDDPEVRAVVGVAVRIASEAPGTLVLALPPEADPSRVVALPARLARALSELIPVLARWDALVAPAGVGSLSRPAPHVLPALRETAEVLGELDTHLATRAHIHHLPGSGVLEAARTAELTISLALMGRTPGPPPAQGDDGSPFVLSLPVPGLGAADLTLDREGDHLVVSAGRHRRVLPLSAMHRRCTVVRAGVSSGVLQVELEPDPEQWPTRWSMTPRSTTPRSTTRRSGTSTTVMDPR
ncbi:hypothetical protein GCM10022199_17390 [Marihabitans asiaticum]|uniref:ArsA HSP20-like domain-containing protein n=1 Tax=Marihabitans asiaticum TaxID=415218 RepID=A0A560W6Z0_9MICO|nr:hypothetical protein [Marihabitans asiaticum]TWD13378.1 hypothetical protein FB557_2779 [Marihabitans asiaticum]